MPGLKDNIVHNIKQADMKRSRLRIMMLTKKKDK